MEDDPLSHVHAAGIAETAQDTERARASCPFLSQLPLEEANVFLELVAIGQRKIEADTPALAQTEVAKTKPEPPEPPEPVAVEHLKPVVEVQVKTAEIVASIDPIRHRSPDLAPPARRLGQTIDYNDGLLRELVNAEALVAETAIVPTVAETNLERSAVAKPEVAFREPEPAPRLQADLLAVEDPQPEVMPKPTLAPAPVAQNLSLQLHVEPVIKEPSAAPSLQYEPSFSYELSVTDRTDQETITDTFDAPFVLAEAPYEPDIIPGWQLTMTNQLSDVPTLLTEAERLSTPEHGTEFDYSIAAAEIVTFDPFLIQDPEPQYHAEDRPMFSDAEVEAEPEQILNAGRNHPGSAVETKFTIPLIATDVIAVDQLVEVADGIVEPGTVLAIAEEAATTTQHSTFEKTVETILELSNTFTRNDDGTHEFKQAASSRIHHLPILVYQTIHLARFMIHHKMSLQAVNM